MTAYLLAPVSRRFPRLPDRKTCVVCRKRKAPTGQTECVLLGVGRCSDPGLVEGLLVHPDCIGPTWELP